MEIFSHIIVTYTIVLLFCNNLHKFSFTCEISFLFTYRYLYFCYA